VIGIKEADRKIHTVAGSRTQATAKKTRRNLVATLGLCITTGIQLDSAVVGSVVAVVVVVVVVLVVGVGHPTGNKQNKTAHQAVQPTKI